jgi:hypothetical protein
MPDKQLEAQGGFPRAKLFLLRQTVKNIDTCTPDRLLSLVVCRDLKASELNNHGVPFG